LIYEFKMINVFCSFRVKFNFLISNITTLVVLFILLPLIIISVLNCTDHENEVLAIIGERTVTIDDFITRYESIRQKMNLPDNGHVRKKIFDNIINEQLFIAEAIKRGYLDDQAGKYEHDRIKIQELLNEFLQKIVFNPIEIHEDELKTLYIQLNTKIKARHLYAATRKQADSLYTEVMNGKSFEELAKDNFIDPLLRDTGGSLGYFSIDEMDPDFENVSYALKIGQISKPVRTAQGYSIIQVQDRIIKPLLTESDYIKHRSKLEDYWRYRKKRKATQAYVDSLRKTLAISFNKIVLIELLDIINKRTPNFEVENSNFFMENDLFKSKEIVRSKIGIWDIETFHKYAKFTSDRQLKWIKKQEDLEDFIAGLVVRAFMLSKAKELGLNKLHNYEKTIQQKLDEYLYKRMEHTVFETIVVPEDTLRIYYYQNQDKYFIPPKIHLSEIVVDNALKAEEIKSILLKKESFGKIAQERSVRKWSAENEGDIGTFTYKELDSYADRLWPLEFGQWIGPIKIDSQYAFFKCFAKYPKRTQSFDEARSEIEKYFRLIWYEEKKQDILRSIRTQIKIVAYPERLESFHIN